MVVDHPHTKTSYFEGDVRTHSVKIGEPVTLGAIVKGETKRDEIIAHVLASKASELFIQHRKPVTVGASGPSMSWEQGTARIESYANRSVDSAIKMVLLHRQIMKEAGTPSYSMVVG